MAFFLHRDSLLHEWQAYALPEGSIWIDGETIPLPNAYFWLQVTEERDRLNSKGGVEQGALEL